MHYNWVLQQESVQNGNCSHGTGKKKPHSDRVVRMRLFSKQKRNKPDLSQFAQNNGGQCRQFYADRFRFEIPGILLRSALSVPDIRAAETGFV